MPLRAKIKFHHSLPFRLERSLVHTYGFAIFSRLNGHYVIFTQSKGEKPKPNPLDCLLLSEDTKTELIRKCNRITVWYERPELHAKSIRTKIYGMSAMFPQQEKDFMRLWCDNNFPGE